MNNNLYQQVLDRITRFNNFIMMMDEKIENVEKEYQSKVYQMKKEHDWALTNFDRECNQAIHHIEEKSSSMIQEAKHIQEQIQKIDENLSRVDKYYVKTKTKKLEELKNAKSDRYQDTSDYFEALKDIKTRFSILSEKYTKDILPSVINHLNYLFSSKRKADYEELIILENTVDKFLAEIKKEMEELTSSYKTDMNEEQKKSREELLQNQADFRTKQEALYQQKLQKLRDEIKSTLDEILEESFLTTLENVVESYKKCYNKVNKGITVENNCLYIGYIDFKIEEFIASKMLISSVKEKCALLITDGIIKFPIIITTDSSVPILIKKSNSNSIQLESFAQGIMYSFLTTVPASFLTFSVVDCENHGNSIEAYFDAKKNMPELFDEKIYTTQQEANSKLKQLNDKVEYITQNVLGNQYDNISSYNLSHPDHPLGIELLTIFDFPSAIDNHALSYLNNIIHYGGKCGIYVLLISDLELNPDKYSKSLIESVKDIQRQSLTIVQSDSSFSCLGLNYVSNFMPAKKEFDAYFSKYILICEGLHNKGIALPSFIKNLMDEKKDEKIIETLEQLKKMKESLFVQMDTSLSEETTFPTHIVIGQTAYPKDIFQESYGYDKIFSYFGLEDEKIHLPFLLNLGECSNFLLEYDAMSEKDGKDFLTHMIWRFLASIPVTKANICIFDPDKKGGSVLPFLDFKKECSSTFDENIYTSSSDITRRLQKFNDFIDDMIQNKLGYRYDNLLDYNLKTPNKMETVTLLAIYDFPVGFDNKSYELLLNILKNGPKCGIFTVIGMHQNLSKDSYDFNHYEKLMTQYTTKISCKDNKYLMLPFHLEIEIPSKVEYSTINSFIKKYTEISNVIKGRGISFEDILDENLFESNSSKILSIPVGVGDEEKIIPITFGHGSSHHALVAGATGSGKSTLLHTLIMSAMLHYTPDMLQLYLMDFKGGTEFKIYDSYRLPHIKLLALDALQEFGESILENLVEEIGIRSQKFKEVNASKLADYVHLANKPMPQILVIMDEFQILFNDATNRKVANHCAELVKRIVTEGRSYGIHLLMATQSTKIIGELTLATGTIEQMRIRIGLKCGEYDTRYLFGDKGNSKILDMMKGPIGTAVLNEEYTEEDAVGMRVVYCDDDTQRKYLELIQEKFQDVAFDMQSFEGNKVTPLLQVLKPNWQTGNLTVRVGNLIKVAPDLSITFDNRKKHNTLICGSNEKMTRNILNIYMLSALLNSSTQLYCIDGDIILGEKDPIYEAYKKLGSRFHLAQNQADILLQIQQLYDLYLENKNNFAQNQALLVIDKLQYLDLVGKMLKGDKIDEEEYLGTKEENTPKEEEEDDPFDFGFLNTSEATSSNANNINVSKKIAQLIENGTTYNIHIIITASDIQTVKEDLYYGINHLSKFPERYLYSLNNNEVSFLADGISLTSLQDNIVYYTDSVRKTFQVKPFIFPESDELNSFILNVLKEDENGECIH